MDSKLLQRFHWKITALILGAMVMVLSVTAYQAHHRFVPTLVPEITLKARTLGLQTANLMSKAVGSGVDYPLLYGVEAVFASLLQQHPEILFVAATDLAGNVVFRQHQEGQLTNINNAITQDINQLDSKDSTGPISSKDRVLGDSGLATDNYLIKVPLETGNQTYGQLYLGLDQSFINNILTDLLLDIIVVLLVCLFLTRELLHFIVGARVEQKISLFDQLNQQTKNGDFRLPSSIRARDTEQPLLQSLRQLNTRARQLEKKIRDASKSGAAETVARAHQAAIKLQKLTSTYRFECSQPLDSYQRTTAPSAPSEVSTIDRNSRGLIRAPLFIFILAEELTRPFLPGYVGELLVPIPGLSPQLVIGFPIVLFMLIVALGQPYFGQWSERRGRRPTLQWGAVLACAGFVGTALAADLYQILFWRSFCAVGYGLIFVSAQGYILDHSNTQDRAKGFALFVGAIMTATICGPSIGGILADNIGSRATFLIAALLAALSLPAIWRLPKEQARTRSASQGLQIGVLSKLLFRPHFLSLTGLAAIPAKMGLTGICFYLIPLYLLESLGNQAMAGRLIMLYGLLMVLIVPIAATHLESRLSRQTLVALGLTLSGCGALPLIYLQDPIAVTTLVISLGVGQALSIASQSALVADRCHAEVIQFGNDTVYGCYRLLERLGNALGPLLAALLVELYGYHNALLAMGLLLSACGLLFALCLLPSRSATRING